MLSKHYVNNGYWIELILLCVSQWIDLPWFRFRASFIAASLVDPSILGWKTLKELPSLKYCYNTLYLHLVFVFYTRVQKLTPSSSGDGLLFRFPEPNTIHDIDWIGVLSRRKKVSNKLPWLRESRLSIRNFILRAEMESDQSENPWQRMVATKKKGQNEVQEMALGLTKFEWEAGYIKWRCHLGDFF